MSRMRKISVVLMCLALSASSSFGGYWSAPVLHSELNDGTGNKAAAPCLSGDGLIMYFSRHIPALGHKCIVEKSRATPSGPFFLTERVAAELAVTGYNVSSPWLSQDGLRLYYHENSGGADAYIKMAQRANTSDPWTPVAIFTEIHAAGYSDAKVSLTGDELIIFWHSTRPGSAGGIDIWTASRASTSEPFSNVTPLSELNTSVNEGGPFILPDGLTIFYSQAPKDGRTTSDIFKAKRSCISEPFGNIKIVEFPGYTSKWEQHPYVTPDEKKMYFETEQNGIWVSHWIIATYHVDGANGNDNNNGLSKNTAFATIQKGIDTAVDGDKILVWPGVYDDFAFEGKAVTVASAADAAVIDAGIGVWFDRSEGPDSVLRNFVIRNCAIGVICSDSSPTLVHLTVVNNDTGLAAFGDSNPDISNCIFWDNEDEDLLGAEARYSCIEDGLAGEGNISVNPRFADAAGGDFHLLSERGRYEAGRWVLDDETSPCIDAGDPMVNPMNEPMPNGARINMGAYGDTAYAGMSEWPVGADLNRDGVVDMVDMAILCSKWLWAAPWAQ